MTLDFTIGPLANPSQGYYPNGAAKPTQLDVQTIRQLDADFQLSIEGVCILQEPFWNVGELAMQLAAWLRAGLPGSFRYDCQEAEEADLFTFERHGQEFVFYSEWQQDAGRRLHRVEQEAVAAFIRRFVGSVRDYIKRDLNLDASGYLGS